MVISDIGSSNLSISTKCHQIGRVYYITYISFYHQLVCLNTMLMWKRKNSGSAETIGTLFENKIFKRKCRVPL